MSFQICDIILYGPTDEPRVLALRPGHINIVTGSSKTGKSALISVVDYCLGSRECGVAYGPIRSTVEWYALRLEVGDRQILLARKAPAEGQETSSAVYLEVAGEVSIPSKNAITQTTNISAAVEILSRAAGIADNLHEPPPEQSREPLAANIKHALYFCFQPQDEIISRKNLFYQQGEPFIPQTIKDVLPYFLGAIGDDYIIKMGQLRDLRRNLKQITRKLSEAEALRGEGTTRAVRLLEEARDLGLIELPGDELPFDRAVALLRDVLERRLPSVPSEEAATAAEYDRILDEREHLARNLRLIDTDLRAARALMNEREGFALEEAESIGRLRSIGIFKQGGDDASHVCPLCSSELDDIPHDAQLVEALEALEQRLIDVDQDNPHLERLVLELEGRARECQERLTENRASMDALQRSQRVVSDYRDFIGRAAHIRGRISIYLEAVPEASTAVADLADRARAVAQQIAELEAELGKESVEERIDSLISIVSSHVTETGRALDLEHSENPLRFNAKKLTVVADTPRGSIPMDKMGSGANWVGYHVAVHLALHRLFVETDRPVPRFLFLDQPSQVYFPADRDTEGRLEVGREGAPVDEDREAVLKMFELIRDTVSGMGGGFQLVIMEHADPAKDWYQDAVVERWRGGNALIPQEWIDALTE